MNKTLEKAIDAVEEAIKPIIKKGEAMTAQELESLTKSICLIEKIKGIQRMDDVSYDNVGYSENYRMYNEPNDYSYRRGRSPVTGRYVSRDSGENSNRNYYDENENSNRYYDGENNSGRSYRENGYHHYNNAGYSGHSKHDKMIAALEHMLDNAQTEHEKNFVKEWLNRIT